MTIQNFDQRMVLYGKGLTDKEIARELGMDRPAVSDWRYRHNLPNINGQSFCPMEQALPAEQCDVMNVFFSRMERLADSNPGKKIDVSKFIKIYRDQELIHAGPGRSRWSY